MNTRVLSAAEAIHEATAQLLEEDRNTILIGEGVPDPKAVFGTTKGLRDGYPDQVFDMPVSENAVTGVCIGASLLGVRSIMVHMRVDFLLYAMDQIVNNAAKWVSMYGGNGGSCPIVIRALIGRGWGAGQQHSQNLESLFVHVPGLKIVCPSTASNAKGLLIAATRDPNPVLFLEHRWVHSLKSEVPQEMFETKIGLARIARSGSDITIVCWGHMFKEVAKAAEFLEGQGIDAEIVDMQSLRPLDIEGVKYSVRKTKHLMVVSEAWRFNGLAGEIIAQVAEDPEIEMASRPRRLCNPDFCPPSSPAMTKRYYVGPADIVKSAADQLNRSIDPLPAVRFQNQRVHDIPDQSFTGPF